jgi:hypothetical protein
MSDKTQSNQTATSGLSVGIRPWGSTPKKTRQYDNNLPQIKYMKLKPGINNVRIITGIGEYFQVRWKGPKSQLSYGDRVRTSFPTFGDKCPVKKYLGLEGKPRSMVVVIDRAEGDLKFLDLSPLALEQIETNIEVKNSMRPEGQKVTPRDFDISIKFDPKAKKATGFYSVVVHDSTPMSGKDFALIEEAGGQEVIDKVLGLQILCPKPEKVLERLKALGWDGKPVPKSDGKGGTAVLEEPEEDDYSFQRPLDEDVDAAANG